MCTRIWLKDPAQYSRAPVDHEDDGRSTDKDNLETPEANVRDRREHVETDICAADLNFDWLKLEISDRLHKAYAKDCYIREVDKIGILF